MLSDEFIRDQIENLESLGAKLNKEAVFAQEFIDRSNNPENEKKWYSSVRADCIYGAFLIKNILDTLDNYKDKSHEQIGFYIGKIAIQPFLDVINSYELSTVNLVAENEYLTSLIKNRIDKKIDLIKSSWKEDSSGAANRLKRDLIKTYERKATEMKFIRDVLHKANIIDDLDKKILEFAWDIRNSMHTNFVAIKDIEFSAPGTSLNYSFSFQKGQELYHPHDLLSFHSITEQIIFIQFKVLQNINKHDKDKT